MLTKEETIDNHKSVLCSSGISTKDEEIFLPSIYRRTSIHTRNSDLSMQFPMKRMNLKIYYAYFSIYLCNSYECLSINGNHVC